MIMSKLRDENNVPYRHHERWHCEKYLKGTGAAKCKCVCHDSFHCMLAHHHHTGYVKKFKHCVPTAAPTAYPTAAPTAYPTSYPTTYPTSYPTTNPTHSPTNSPTHVCDHDGVKIINADWDFDAAAAAIHGADGEGELIKIIDSKLTLEETTFIIKEC
jgi:hypothetical protein